MQTRRSVLIGSAALTGAVLPVAAEAARPPWETVYFRDSAGDLWRALVASAASTLSPVSKPYEFYTEDRIREVFREFMPIRAAVLAAAE